MYENLFEYTDIDGDKFQVYQCWGEYYFKVNGESVELPIEVIPKLIETLNDKCKKLEFD